MQRKGYSIQRTFSGEDPLKRHYKGPCSLKIQRSADPLQKKAFLELQSNEGTGRWQVSNNETDHPVDLLTNERPQVHE